MTILASKHLVSNSGYTLVLVHGFDHSKRKVFYYIAVKKMKLELLKKKTGHGEIVLHDYGTVLMSEYGYEPTEKMQKEALEKFIDSIRS